MLLTLLFLIGALQPVAKEDYNHAVDYIGWQIMDAYMKDYTVIRPDRTAEAKGYDVFKQKFPVENYSIENPPESDTVKQVLSNNDWSNANKSLYSRIINWKSMYDADWNGQQAADYLKGQIENISLKTLGVDDSAYTNLQITKAQLQDEIVQYFAPAPVAAPAASISESPQESYEIPEGYEQEDMMVEGEDNSFSLFSNMAEGQAWLDYRLNVISLGLILLLTGLLIYLFSMFKKVDERLDKHRKEINDLKSEVFILNRKLKDLGGDSKLRGRMDALESKVNKINTDHRPQEPGGIKTTNTVYTPANVAVAAKPKTEEFYLSTPNSDGSFNVSSMSSSYKPTASIYKFEVSEEDGENVATFTVADQYEAIKDALSSPGSYLDPVCESENAFSPSARKIVNVKPGRAFRRGEQWIVRQEDKAIIRYE